MEATEANESGAVADVLERDLDADGHRVRNLAEPTESGDATFTDNETTPKPNGGRGSPGKSRLAAPADHVHPTPESDTPFRLAASGLKTFIAGGATVTLATFKRNPGELFPAGGYLWVRDDVDGVTWEAKASDPKHIAAYHERTEKPDEVRFKAKNGSQKGRTIDWATVALRAG
jgi:hypothetical protein